MRRGKINKFSLLLIFFVSIFTLLAYFFDQMVIRTEDKIRNIKIEYQLSKNKVSKQESMSTSLNNIAIRIDLIQSPHLLNRNYLTKSLMLIESDNSYKNFFSEDVYENSNFERAIKWNLIKKFVSIVSSYVNIKEEYDMFYIINEEYIKKINKNKIKYLDKIFSQKEIFSKNKKDFFIKNENIYNKVLGFNLSDDDVAQYRENIMEDFTIKNWFDVYKYKMLYLRKLNKVSNILEELTDLIDAEVIISEQEKDNVFLKLQSTSIKKNYFILLSIITQVLSLLFLLILFRHFLVSFKAK